MDATIEQWLRTRPENVQAVARRHPPGGRYELNGGVGYLIGYSEVEEDGEAKVVLRLSMIDPHEDYEGAVRDSFLVHPEHYEQG